MGSIDAILITMLASAPPAVSERTVTVSATGEASAQPDRARISIGVETQAKTAQQALSANNRKVEALLRSVRSARIPAKQIETSQISLHPVYSSREGGEAQLVGYRAENQVAVTSTELDSLGSLLDAAVESGANRILGLSFEVSDPTELLSTARTSAMKQAQRAARELASLANLELGAAISIREGSARPPHPMAMAMEARSGVPIEPGMHEVTYTVEVTYALESKRTAQVH